MDDDSESGGNREAARYRVQRNEARSERDEARRQRDQIQQQLDEARHEAVALRQSIVDSIATAAGLADPGLLAYEGHALDTLLNDDGVPDEAKVRHACTEVIKKHRIASRQGLLPNPQQGKGAGRSRGSSAEQFAKAFAPSR